MKHIGEYISEGAGKFLVNRKAVNADSDGFIEGDFKCVFAYSGSSQAVSCASYKREDDEITALLDKRITHNMTQNFQKHNANVAIYDAGSERVVLRGHRLQECSIVSGDESVRRVRMAFKRIEIVEDDMRWPMNGLESYMQESAPHFLVSKKANCAYAPENKNELVRIIKERIKSEGAQCSLNDIDVSAIDDFSNLFTSVYALTEFNGEISRWDVSNAADMQYMFYKAKFNGDISEWNVSSVTDMRGMFAASEFNNDISHWDTSKVKSMEAMFWGSKFDGDISKWDVSNVEFMISMFRKSAFNGDISKWNVSNVIDMSMMFKESAFNGDLSKWNVRNNNMHTYMFEQSEIEKHPEKQPKFAK